MNKKHPSDLCLKKFESPAFFRFHVKGNFLDSSIIILYNLHMISAYILLNIIAPVQSLRVKATHFFRVTHPSHSINSKGNFAVAKSICAFFLFSLAQNRVVPHRIFFLFTCKVIFFSYWSRKAKMRFTYAETKWLFKA